MKNRSFLLIVLFAATLSAQVPRGKIVGSVFDETINEPIFGANVLILGTQLGAATDIEGRFEILNVPVGEYALRITVINFKPVTKTNIVVTSVMPAEVDVRMRETVIELEAVTVRPDYFSDTADKPISTRMQTNEEIRQLPGGFGDVVRAVSILPGVAQPSGGRNDLIVRGGAPSENLYLIDGLEIPNINHFGTQGAGGGPLSYINLNFVESTTFSTGGFGARYGDRLSSVLTLDLRDGRKDRWGGLATLSASQFGLDIEGPTGKNGSTYFSARRSYLDFIFKANGFGFVPEYWDFLTKTRQKLGKQDEISLIAVGAIDRTRFFNDTEEKRTGNAQILGNSQNQANAALSWKHLFRRGFTRLTLGEVYTDYTFQQSDTAGLPVFGSDARESITSLTFTADYNFSPRTELSGGMQIRLAKIRNALLLPPFQDEFGTLISANSDFDDTTWKSAAWFQVTHRFPLFDMGLGARADYFDLIDNPWAVSPRLTLKYKLTESTRLITSVGRYHQAPSYVWVMSLPENRRLDHIRADQLIFGAERILREDTQLTLEAYWKTYDRYPASQIRPWLVMSNTGSGFGGSQEGFASFGVDPLVSEGTGKARGVELFVQKKLSESPFYGTFSLSWNESEFTALDGISRPGSYDQRWILNLGGGTVFGPALELSFKYRFFTGRPYTPYNTDFTRSVDLYNSARLDNGQFLDLRVDRRWYFENRELIAFVDVQNVFNRLFPNVPQYNQYTGELEDQDGIGILPTIGLSFMF